MIYEDPRQWFSALTSVGEPLIRADDIQARLLGFQTLSGYLLQIPLWIMSGGAGVKLGRRLGIRTPADRDALAIRLSTEPEKVWSEAQSELPT